MSDSVYDKNFYEIQQDGSFISAQEVWPVVFKYIRPASVIDIGCGVGPWLRALDGMQISDYLGVDGDYVKTESLQIPRSKFVSHDLTGFYKASRKYDMAMSLEVGEHLPDASADDLVRSLTHASDVVLFSAALPGQGGVYHINEQWPEYWAAKFSGQGFTVVDAIRKQIWHNDRIDVWYRQNMLLYVRTELLERPEYAQLKELAGRTDKDFLTRIHPELFLYYQKKMNRLSTFEGFARFKLAPLKKK